MTSRNRRGRLALFYDGLGLQMPLTEMKSAPPTGSARSDCSVKSPDLHTISDPEYWRERAEEPRHG